MTDISSMRSLENTIQEYIRISNSSWYKFYSLRTLILLNILKHGGTMSVA